ncbi:MAG: hypothetical protein NT067_01855 [Candidatus Diapherotrites archaeon]|nr:hypothetical protein [Candidatus Diapherotrites archaeon]
MADILQEALEKVREINKKYEKPKIHTSKGVKFALLMLRLYLIFLVCVLAYKFFTLVVGGA